jgi:hypothetical protein
MMIDGNNKQLALHLTELDGKIAEHYQGGKRNSDLTLFQYRLFRGKSLKIGGQIEPSESQSMIPKLQDSNFDNITSSVVVRRGVWVLYKKPNYKGHGFILAPGRYANLPANLNNDLSSLKRIG